ncbi:hypothetical protein FVB32_14875 [Flagellimonas hymeniacidonis]|uniref:Uncharacterized protein n=1 Tax=Flagellimonas hymeniacidonis TaxID=2603628 RepID=A0A5C8V520_9FLAO|nr:hypothetical protein [Flagellimonas hymeniacidonis]TXN35848.1 hypothetical protein FVB32_14875 [Flagellimonas hymeniacidonis]
MRIVKKILVVIFLLVLNGCKNPYDKYEKVTISTELDLDVRTHVNSRGGSIINDKYLFLSFCPLISEAHNEKYAERDDLYYAYAWTPYRLYKRKGERSFYIIQQKDTLQYKLILIEEMQ